MNIDLLLMQELESLASYGHKSIDDLPSSYNIPFGHVAFIHEKVWQNESFYKKAKEKRASHPGLSISSSEQKVAFGTSQTDNRSNSKDHFWVSPKECDILNRTVVFLLSLWAPADIFRIDSRKSNTIKSMKILCKSKLSELKNAGYY